MLGSKAFATSILLTSTTSIFKKQNSGKINAECQDNKNAAAEAGVADLDKIFGEAAEGGIPPDPEEIQELLMKAQGRTIR